MNRIDGDYEAVPHTLRGLDGSGDIPSDWTRVAFGTLVDRSPETISPGEGQGLPYVGLEHLDSGSARIARWGKASDVRSTKALFKPGDILYGKLRPYLDKAALAEWAGFCSTDILVFLPRPNVCAMYVAYLVHGQRFIDHATSTTAGVNHPRTSWSSLRAFKVPLPTLPEQRAIAHVLQTVQQAREAIERVIAAARELKRSLLRYLFTYGPVPVEEADKVPLKETEIGAVPEHWRVAPVGSVSTRLQYGLSERGAPVGDYPILRMNNLMDGHVAPANLQYVNINQEVFDRFRLSRGDVLFNRTNSHELVGKVGLFDLPGEYVFASYLVRVAVATPTMPEYVAYILNEGRTQARLKRLAARAVSQSNISASKLRDFPIPLPPPAEQQHVVEALTAVDHKIAAEGQRRKALDTLFKSLLEQLMSGARRVPVGTSQSCHP